jgi:acyl carrier protein
VHTDFITQFLRSKRPELAHIDENLDLIENRILQSLHFVEFLYLLEEATGQEITLDEVIPDDFRTIARIKERFFDDH